MSDRRFTEDEVAEILKNAVEIQDSHAIVPATRTGLTLDELQDIGAEVGVTAEAIQRAARRLEPAPKPSRTILGLPLGVGKTVELGRTLSDPEWERVVAQLRETFEARGVMRSEGSMRSWSNGNLQVMLEPGKNGQRLRMRTVNGNAQGWIFGGSGILLTGIAMTIAAIVTGVIGEDAGLNAALIGLVGSGAGMLGIGTLRLPKWARTRQRQMDEIADRVSSNSIN